MPQTLLGFDYGRLRTGVAVGQTLTGTATALVTLQSRHHKPDWDGIDRLIREWQPDGLVVGIPVHMDGTEQEMTKTARKFGGQLKARYNLPVYEADERLSSAEAEQNLGGGQDKAAIDREAARLILQAWLNEQGME
ncbi:Holliday junction resolvase RuvX [Sulfuriflexus sp.]|uniref:Holliday junction resolvase RuvX n=1 Tax=Sulfuriflexus sp. TaxID=2015443 RepID=UPI0028CC4589|nr:Holliday junction resolvase RuvX [Sulfuriflexus sp.]MDT8403138.1 Holliday junction resolvase RuvX [Sulfuriflexus sp.]